MAIELLHAPARQAGTLSEIEHRPWPLPGGSWILGQSWEDLLFAHWRVDADALRRFVPGGLHIDEQDGGAWLGITPFVLTGFRLRGTLPLPMISSFGAVEAARRVYKLPYFHARISVDRRGDRVDYSSKRRGTARPFVFAGSYGPAGEPFTSEAGSLEHFLTERYCLYAADGSGLHRAEIHHPPWRIRPANADLELNTMPPDGLELEGEPLFHLAERQDVVIWPLERVAAGRKSAS